MSLHLEAQNWKDRIQDIGKRSQGWRRILQTLRRTKRLCNFSLKLTTLETKKLVMKEIPMQKNDEDMFVHLAKRYYIYSEGAFAK